MVYRQRYLYPVLINLFMLPSARDSGAVLDEQHSKVMALMNECRLTPMVHGRWVRATSSHRLVPGDVIVLHRGRALHDMVVLRGACLVTEAMLSGEVYLLSNKGSCCSHTSSNLLRTAQVYCEEACSLASAHANLLLCADFVVASFVNFVSRQTSVQCLDRTAHCRC